MTDRNVLLEMILEPGTGKALEMKAGQILRIEQVEGLQCVDFNCFNLHDYKEFMHCGRTRTVHGFNPTKGAFLGPSRRASGRSCTFSRTRSAATMCSFRAAAPMSTRAPTASTHIPIVMTFRPRRSANTASPPTTCTTASTSSCTPRSAVMAARPSPARTRSPATTSTSWRWSTFSPCRTSAAPMSCAPAISL